jgi:hypothetical protein
MLEITIQILALAGLSSLPFIFMGYVQSRVRHALRAVSREN